MTKKLLSTFEQEMQNPKFKSLFEASYKKFLQSELRLAKEAGDKKSIDDLTKELTKMESNHK